MQGIVGNPQLLTLRYSPLMRHLKKKKLLYSLIIHLDLIGPMVF